jgi:hypothetical protein
MTDTIPATAPGLSNIIGFPLSQKGSPDFAILSTPGWRLF